MKFRAMAEHMKGSKLNLNGTIYPIDKNGIVDVPDDEGAKLIQIDGWVHITGKGGPAVPLVDEDGLEADSEPEVEIDEDIEVDEAEIAEIPDPSMDMTKAQLIELAEAYEIDTKGMNKQQLVDAINEKMYPED